MKKLFASIAIFCIVMIGSMNLVNAQNEPDTTKKDSSTVVAPTDQAPTTETAPTENSGTVKETGWRQMLKDQFIQGDYRWMSPVLLCLILGLALVIERVIYLNMASVNTTKLLNKLEGALKAGGVEEAKNVCRSTSGPVAGIFLEGLNRTDEGAEIVEKAIISYGGVEMGKMERGLTWISLFIALAPMLGFLGTVVGMIQAFADIEAAGDISPQVVAGGIKVALLTTTAGLLVAIVLQIFYNYLTSKIESLTGNMEEASIDFIDMLIKTGTVNKA